MENKNIIPHNHKITKSDRNIINNHKSIILWFTGLSGSGKSTIASRVEEKLFERNIRTFILDGDNVRAGLNKGLGFSDQDRMENLRRIAEVAKLMSDAGLVVLAAFISPKSEEREFVKQIVGQENFIEIFVNCPLETCEQRDSKGLYKKARAGEIKDFIGIHTEFENPKNPDLILKSDKDSIEGCANQVIDYILPKINL